MNLQKLPPNEQIEQGLWRLHCMLDLAKECAFNEVSDLPTMAHLLETMSEQAEALHLLANQLNHSQVSKAVQA
ncbi:hypothetical protein [uncultured Thiothrix sp.]|uniref:hypothetical protein n=1 Tax=uncultured Thiothrix sp. TaxID=223185 RepID=UPI00261011C9|nr:hypothetical protein [uncultured Thiothrix sp.]